MATSAQILANQANSQKSTGPVTDAGKAKSSLNRLSHGFASNKRFMRGEDPTQFDALLDSLILEFQPTTTTQQILVEKMAHHQWISLRASRIQDELITRMAVVGDVARSLPLMIRYETAAERAFYKAHTELVKAQKQTPNREIGFESKNAPDPVKAAAEAAPQPAESIPEPPESAPQPPAPAPQPTKPTPVTAPARTATPEFPSIDAELDWVMNASVREIRASGL